MSDRAALDSYIETLQILAREGDSDRTDEERKRDAAYRAKLIDAHAHELAELQRLRMDELDLTGQKARFVGRIVDLIDPYVNAAPERPAGSEEKTG